MGISLFWLLKGYYRFFVFWWAAILMSYTIFCFCSAYLYVNDHSTVILWLWRLLLSFNLFSLLGLMVLLYFWALRDNYFLIYHIFFEWQYLYSISGVTISFDVELIVLVFLKWSHYLFWCWILCNYQYQLTKVIYFLEG